MPLFIGSHQTRSSRNAEAARIVDVKLQSTLIMYDVRLVNQVIHRLPHCLSLSPLSLI